MKVLRQATGPGPGPRQLLVSIAVVAACGLIGGAAEPKAAIARMQELLGQYKTKELVAEFAAEDFAGWPPQAAAEALQLRGRAYAARKEGRKAEADFARAVAIVPRHTALLINRGDNLRNNLGDDTAAMAVYREVCTINGASRGWDTITATLSMAGILTDQVRTDEALALLDPFRDATDIAPVWRIKLLRCRGAIHAAAGREAESLAAFREALRIESETNRPAPAKKDAALAPAPLLPGPGPQYGTAARLYQGVPTIARNDASGRLWAAWYAGGRGESQDNYVLVVTSGDEGASWTEPVLVIDPPDAVRAFDPCLWTAPDGRLLLDDRAEVSYPDAVEASDGRLLIIYDRGRGSDREILLAVTSETDILAGVAGSATRLRMLVNKATAPR